MRRAHRDVAITGLGAVCALGEDCASLWSAIEVGRCGIGPVRRFPTESFSVTTGALVPRWAETRACDGPLAVELCHEFAEAAAREALAHAGLEDGSVPRERIGLVFGTGLGDIEHPSHLLAEYLADATHLAGPRITVSTACSSSTGALGIARDLIAMDAADVVLAGGADVLTPEVFAGFHALGVLSPSRCAPFSVPFGTSLGEGAGFMVLERADAARDRGAGIIAVLAGYGLSGDAHHETSPDSKGTGIERALRGALCDAALEAHDIGYVNAHGSGTEANDRAEWLGIRRALGVRAEEMPISSTKGALGHAQGAAGVLEAIVTLLAMRRGLVPPTLNFAGPRPLGPPDAVPGPVPRAVPCAHALCVNAAFGGANAAVVLSLHPRPAPPRDRQPVAVAGVGLVGAHGLGTEGFGTAPGGSLPGGRVPDFRIEHLVPTADPRGLDPTSRFLTAACALALADAGVHLRGERRDRAGLVVGMRRPSPASLDAFSRSIADRGLPNLSAAAFARIVLNAPAGFSSKLLGLRGPLSVLTTGAGSGLAAIVHAAEILSTQAVAELMLAGAADEAPERRGGEGEPAESEGSACVLLTREANAVRGATAPSVHLAGWGLAGPGRLADAVARAVSDQSEAACGARVFRSEDWAGSAPVGDGALASALACAAAVLTVRRGEAPSALVTSEGGCSVTAAVLLVGEGGPGGFVA